MISRLCFIFFLILAFPLFSLEFYVERPRREKNEWNRQYPVCTPLWEPEIHYIASQFPYEAINPSPPLRETWSLDVEDQDLSGTEYQWGAGAFYHKTFGSGLSGMVQNVKYPLLIQVQISSDYDLQPAGGLYMDWSPLLFLNISQNVFYSSQLFWAPRLSFRNDYIELQGLYWTGVERGGPREHYWKIRGGYTDETSPYKGDFSHYWDLKEKEGSVSFSASRQYSSMTLEGTLGGIYHQEVLWSGALAIRSSVPLPWELSGGWIIEVIEPYFFEEGGVLSTPGELRLRRVPQVNLSMQKDWPGIYMESSLGYTLDPQFWNWFQYVKFHLNENLLYIDSRIFSRYLGRIDGADVEIGWIPERSSWILSAWWNYGLELRDIFVSGTDIHSAGCRLEWFIRDWDSLELEGEISQNLDINFHLLYHWR